MAIVVSRETPDYSKTFACVLRPDPLGGHRRVFPAVSAHNMVNALDMLLSTTNNMMAEYMKEYVG